MGDKPKSGIVFRDAQQEEAKTERRPLDVVPVPQQKGVTTAPNQAESEGALHFDLPKLKPKPVGKIH